MIQKNSFLLYKDSLNILDDLTDEECGLLFRAIKDFQINGRVEIKNRIVNLAFRTFENQFIRDEEKYQEISNKRSQAGKNHKGNQYSIVGQNGTNGTSVPIMEQNGTNGTDSDSVSDNDKDSDNLNIKENISCEILKKDPDKPDQPAPKKSRSKNKNFDYSGYNAPIIEEATKIIETEKLSPEYQATLKFKDKYSKFIIWISKEHPDIVANLKLMNRKKYEKLRAEFPDWKEWERVLDSLDNKEKYLKDYKDLGMTLSNWLASESPRPA